VGGKKKSAYGRKKNCPDIKKVQSMKTEAKGNRKRKGREAISVGRDCQTRAWTCLGRIDTRESKKGRKIWRERKTNSEKKKNRF